MKKTVLFAVLLSCGAADAELLDRAGGIKIGERMTLRPYVALSYSYDSNVRSSHDDRESGNLWSISPSATLAYDAESWSMLLSGYYNYRQYFEKEFETYGHHSYGEDLRWNWANSTGAEKGWSLVLGQSFRQITSVDDMVTPNGHNYNTDSRQFQLAASLMRRFNEYWHGDVNADYYWLDYMTSRKSAGAYYGWDRWRVGAEAGFAPSQWTDLIVSGAYQGYSQDNVTSTGISDESRSLMFQAGLGSYMTERISYRLLAGWSRFEYGDGASTSDGFVYTASGNWKIGETWNTMLIASSYYQPSERLEAASSRVDAFSWGLAKVMVSGKLRATLDLRYRRETNESAVNSHYDYVLNILTGRIGLNYSLNRFLSCYGAGEYQRSINDSSSSLDYDRFRLTLGLSLSY